MFSTAVKKNEIKERKIRELRSSTTGMGTFPNVLPTGKIAIH